MYALPVTSYRKKITYMAIVPHDKRKFKRFSDTEKETEEDIPIIRYG